MASSSSSSSKSRLSIQVTGSSTSSGSSKPPPVSRFFLQGLKTRKRENAPTNFAQYYNLVSNGTQYNHQLTADREYNLQRYWTVMFYGYEAVIDRKKRKTLASATPSKTPMFSISNRSKSPLPSPSSASSYAAKKQASNQMETPRKTNSINTKLFTKSVGNPSTTPIKASISPRKADLTVGRNVVVQNTPDLASCGVAHLAGRKGQIFATPKVGARPLYAVMFQDTKTIHHVPGNSLRVDTPTTPATPSAVPHKVEHSFQMHQLMQLQFREVQLLQKQYADARLANPSLLPRIQAQLSSLRNKHLVQIQQLKQRQLQELSK